MGLVLGLVAVLLFLFVREVLPVPLTALLATIVLTASGILSLEDGFSGFSNQATVAVLAMFVLSAGIHQTGAIDALTRRMSAWAGTSHRRQIAVLGLASGPISGFINNTPVVAVLIPAALQMARKAGISPSRLLMPVSNIAMLGGLLTVIGTSTTLLGNATMARLGVEPFGFFEFFLVGLVALAVGILYYLTLGLRLLPDRGTEGLVERFDLKGFLAEFLVPDDSELVGQTLREAGLSFASGRQVARLTRRGYTIDAPSPAMRIQEGDLLLVEASREGLDELGRQKGLAVLSEVEHPLKTDGDGDLATGEVVITTGSRYVGRTVAQIDFRNRYEALVLAVRHHGRTEVGPISKSRLSPGDVLLVQATPGALERMREKPDLYLTREREQEQYRRSRMPHAFLIVAAVVLVAALGWLHISVAALAGAVLMVITGCLRMDEFMNSVHWDVILLLAGIIPLGIALETTGLAALMAGGVADAGAHVPPVAFLVLLFLATSLITGVVSNSATVVLLIPVAVVAATGLGLDPRPVALTVTLSASVSMITPIGYQTNTMVYAPGNYRFSDYFRVGGPLNLILAVVIPVTIAWLFPL